MDKHIEFIISGLLFSLVGGIISNLILGGVSILSNFIMPNFFPLVTDEYGKNLFVHLLFISILLMFTMLISWSVGKYILPLFKK